MDLHRMVCDADPWPGFGSQTTPAEVPNERVECPCPRSDFGRAMSELSLLQWRLHDVHAREVASLNMANARLAGQVADLQARIGKLVGQAKADHSNEDISVEQVFFSLTVPPGRWPGSFPADKVANEREAIPFPVDFRGEDDDRHQNTSVIDSSSDSDDDSLRIAIGPRKSALASGICEDSSEESDTMVAEQSTTGLANHDSPSGSKEFVPLDPDSQLQEPEDGIDAPPDETEDAPHDTAFGVEGSVSHAVSMISQPSRRATQRTSVNTIATQMSSVQSMRSQESMKAERRATRLRTNLKSRLRSLWAIGEDVEDIVPRWSQTSQVTFDSDFLTSFRNSKASRSSRGSVVFGFGMQPSMARLAHWTTSRPCCLTNCVVHPQSRFKVVVDLLGIFVMGYDFIATPLLFFDLPESAFGIVMGWSTRIFWTLDMWFNFHVAIYKRGVLVAKLRVVALQYIKTMFILDFMIVFVDWLAYILEQTSGNDANALENIYLFRILKALRFAKVFRIFKFERIMQEFRAQINSTILLLWLKPLILLFFLLVFNHTLACVWYGIGKSSTGWTRMPVPDSSFGYMYATSLHWAVSQFHGNMEVFPQNLQERVFMCGITIVALILYSTFLSSITNGMMQIHALRAQRNEREHRLRGCLSRRHVSPELTMRIKKRLGYLRSSQEELDAEEKILAFLPRDLVMDLMEESRGPHVTGHCFFYNLQRRTPRIVRQLCYDTMCEMSHPPEHTIFSPGDACAGMSFITNGELTYELPPTRARRSKDSGAEASQAPPRNSGLGLPMTHGLTMDSVNSMIVGSTQVFVLRGSWLAEAVLWLIWDYCGRLVSRSPCDVILLDAEKFGNLVSKFHFAHVNSARYAKTFIERMVRQERCTDIVPDDL